MRTPRDLSGADLAKAMNRPGYRIVRHTGSHIHLTTQQNGEHHASIPNHDALRVGTLADILSDLSARHNMTCDEVLLRLFP